MLIERDIVVRSPVHLRLVASLPCLVTGAMNQSHAHHLLRGTGQKGMAQKAGDNFTIPLHHKIHDALHRSGDEVGFLEQFGIINQVDLANRLYLFVHPWEAEEHLCSVMARIWRENQRSNVIKKILRGV